MNPEKFRDFARSARDLESLPLYIDDTPGLTIAALRTRARRMKRRHQIGLIIVDYLQLLQGSGRGGESNRVQEISEISRGLKTLAKELNVPVMALSQLSRAVEQREDKKPQLSDLRESGSIEQDADIVMFVYREEYYVRGLEPKRPVESDSSDVFDKHNEWLRKLQTVENLAEVIVAKQRHGATGTVPVPLKASSRCSATIFRMPICRHRWAEWDRGRATACATLVAPCLTRGLAKFRRVWPLLAGRRCSHRAR